MAFWNRKTEEPVPSSLVDEDLLDRIEKSLYLSKESTDHVNTSLMSMSRSIQELTRALDKSTKELMRRK